jgi:hypothetical protein
MKKIRQSINVVRVQMRDEYSIDEFPGIPYRGKTHTDAPARIHDENPLADDDSGSGSGSLSIRVRIACAQNNQVHRGGLFRHYRKQEYKKTKDRGDENLPKQGHPSLSFTSYRAGSAIQIFKYVKPTGKPVSISMGFCIKVVQTGHSRYGRKSKMCF